jgi:hypothetical protein
MHPGLHRRRSGRIRVDDSAIEFLPDDPADRGARIALSELVIVTGGENNSFVYLSRSGDPDSTIATTDESILVELRHRGVRQAGSAEAGVTRRRRRRLGLLIGFFGSIALLIALVPFVIARLPRDVVAKLVDERTERRLGELLISSGAVRFEAPGPADEMLGRIVAYLQKNNPDLAERKIEIRVNRSPEVNAFALPGGIVAVNSGLIENAKAIDEVVGVIAHEIAHVQERHAIRGLGGSLSFTAGAGMLGLFVSPEAAAWVLRGGNLTLLKYSRDHEREADRLGVRYIQEAGISGEALIRFLEGLGAKEGKGGSTLSFLRTHPVTSDRIAELREASKTLRRKAMFMDPIPVSLEELQAAVRSGS